MEDTAKPRSRNWLAGRSDRREYWAYVGVLVVISIVIAMIPGAPTQAGATGVLMLVQIRRFHDLGRSGWWVLALTAAQIALVVPAVLLWPDDLGTTVALIVGLGTIIAMGAIPGQPHENRFGPPRRQRSLKEIFS